MSKNLAPQITNTNKHRKNKKNKNQLLLHRMSVDTHKLSYELISLKVLRDCRRRTSMSCDVTIRHSLKIR